MEFDKLEAILSIGEFTKIYDDRFISNIKTELIDKLKSSYHRNRLHKNDYFGWCFVVMFNRGSRYQHFDFPKEYEVYHKAPIVYIEPDREDVLLGEPT